MSSHTSEPSRTAESDTQSKRSSHSSNTSARRSSPAQSQPKQGSFSQTDHSESVGKSAERVRSTQRSSSSSDSDSDIDIRPPAPPKAQALNGDLSKTQASAGGGQKPGEPILAQQGVSVGATLNGSSGSFGGSIPGERRKGRFRQEFIQCPPTQGAVRQVRNRLPTPEPDTIERILVQRTGPEIIEEITEIPTTPPPIVQEKHVVEPAGPPQVVKRTVRVPPRGTGAVNQQPCAPLQYSDNLLSAGNYAGGQQASGNFQQSASGFTGGFTGAANMTGGFTGAANMTGGFGAVGAGAQFPAPIVFSVNTGAGQSQAVPPLGCHPAFCFYI